MVFRFIIRIIIEFILLIFHFNKKENTTSVEYGIFPISVLIVDCFKS